MSPLWPFVGRTEVLPKAVAFFVGISLLFLWIAVAKTFAPPEMYSAIAGGLVLVSCSVAGVWQYRRNRRSLRAILRLFQMTAWPLALSFVALVLALGCLTGSIYFYAAHWLVILTVYLGLLFVLSSSYIAYRRVFRDQYLAFASYRATGSIPADALYEILSFQGRSTRAASRTMGIVGVSVPLFAVAGLALSHVLHRDVRETLGFCIFFLLSNYFMAVLIARRWLQWRYLGGSDLRVVD